MESAKKPRIIAFVNQKGGVLKTTLTAQVAYGLARTGFKVLAIDMDPQGNLSQALHTHEEDNPAPFITALDALEQREIRLAYGVTENLNIVPADASLSKAEMGFGYLPDSHALLKKAIEKMVLFPAGLDFILVDSPPNIGLLTRNIIYAATEVVIPMTCDNYAMNGVAVLMDFIDIIKEANKELVITGVVPCKVDTRRVIDQQSMTELARIFGDKVFKTQIPECTALKVAGGLGLSIWEHDSRNLVVTRLADLCLEILERSPYATA